MRKIIGVTILVWLANTGRAMAQIVPDSCRGAADLSECNLSAVEDMIVTVAEFILGLAGSLALAMFVYGGVLYILAGASQGMLTKAKNAIKYAVIGLVIILSAGLIMKLVVQALTS
ncbi:TPA: hypothetical protein DF272_00485 [Candidatus Falkowbacteria bacterium]|nr:hypothetical protein [Candidatus Falkowbacteria bacterium]